MLSQYKFPRNWDINQFLKGISGNFYAVVLLDVDKTVIKIGASNGIQHRLYQLFREILHIETIDIESVITWHTEKPFLLERVIQNKLASFHVDMDVVFKGSHEVYNYPEKKLKRLISTLLREGVKKPELPLLPCGCKLITPDMKRDYDDKIRNTRYSKRVVDFFEMNQNRESYAVFKIAEPPRSIDRLKLLQTKIKFDCWFGDCCIPKRNLDDAVFKPLIDWYAFVGQNPFPLDLISRSKEWYDYGLKLRHIESEISRIIGSFFLRADSMKILCGGDELSIDDLIEIIIDDNFPMYDDICRGYQCSDLKLLYDKFKSFL